MPTGRPVLTVALDEDTHQWLQEFSKEQGITIAALVEAFARATRRDPRWLPGLLRDARKIFWERKSRLP